MRTRRTFKKTDHLSGDGMLTTVWGPSLWHTLHTISFNYPVHPTEEDKVNYRNFILQLEYVLPCKYCRINLKKNFQVVPLTMEEMKDRNTFSRYVYTLHEHINTMLGKKSGLSYCDVRERYENFRARCNDPKKQVESGCTEPLVGEKAKCILLIVPQSKKCETFQMDKSCIKKRLHTKRRKITQHRNR
jgi:hypothetical protein